MFSMPQEETKSAINRRVENRIEKMVLLTNEIRDRQESLERTDALVLAKLIAITSLPLKRTKDRDRLKIFRLGQELWAKITLTSAKGQELPFGEDRFVLAGIMHLAIQSESPIVFFKHACELLKMFEVSTDRQGYRLLRERFKRISGLSITIQYATSEEDFSDRAIGENMFVIHKYALPTRKEIEDEKAGQMFIPGINDNPELNNSPFGVKLSSEFWEYLRDPKNQLIIPINLLKLFIDRPTGWDYALFLHSRCGAAKTSSVIDHETLMQLFKEGKEPDRNTVARLQKYHKEIMFVTDKRFNAQLIEDSSLPQQGRGRKKKRWKLCVGPSEKIVWSGKKPGLSNLSSF